MKSAVRTYFLLVSLLFAACLFPGTGNNCMHAQVASTTATDSLISASTEVAVVVLSDSNRIRILDTLSQIAYKPDPKKAVWYSALCPGLGQLYNRRYWKLPLVAASAVGIAYAIGWNSKYYNAYTNAYRDISDRDPKTDSYLDLLPKTSASYNTDQLKTVLMNRQQTYRRSRDLSFIGAVGIYLFCMIDAYVDAQLYDFDISPDLSFRPSMSPPGAGGAKGLEVSLAFPF